MDKRDKGIAILGIIGIVTIAAGLGGAFGWPYALMGIGVAAISISIAAT